MRKRYELCVISPAGVGVFSSSMALLMTKERILGGILPLRLLKVAPG